MRAFIGCVVVGVAAFALVPYVHPAIHEGEAFGAALSGLLLAAVAARLVSKRSDRDATKTRERRQRRLRELAS